MKIFFLNFTKWRIFSGKTVFLQISADFVTGFEKLFFYLKALQARMQIDVNNFFYSSSCSGDIREKHDFQNQLDVYFCYSL